MSEPWKDWIPGVLSKGQLKELHEQGYILNIEKWKDDDSYSAFDLTLTNEGYRMTKGSVKPFGDCYESQIKHQALLEKLEPDQDGAYLLKRTCTYLFKLKERLHVNLLRQSRLYGQATAKSTIGRMDVLARLIVDGADYYEGFDPRALGRGNGDMYLEITPMTFNVRVKEGIQLSQLRIFRGNPDDSIIGGEEVYEPLLHVSGGDAPGTDGSLSVDLQPTPIVPGHDASAFCANRMEENDLPIDLWPGKPQGPLPCKYWRFRQWDSHKRITIEKTHFYIIRSRERISLPGGVAVYCRASDEKIGEMRIHYAGFVHPFFGTDRKDGTVGTPLIFEVRGHDVNVSLQHAEKMAQLVFYRMSAIPEKISKTPSDGRAPPEDEKTYNEQTLRLSKLWAPWPLRLEIGADGTVRNLTE
jgi:dCTP deaminase